MQPLTVEPFTKIQANSTWENSIHFGTEHTRHFSSSGISVLRIPPSRYHSGGPVFAVATMKGTGEYTLPPPKTLAFSGHEWEVRQIPSDRGGQNDYDLGERLDGLGGASTSPARDA